MKWILLAPDSCEEVATGSSLIAKMQCSGSGTLGSPAVALRVRSRVARWQDITFEQLILLLNFIYADVPRSTLHPQVGQFLSY